MADPTPAKPLPRSSSFRIADVLGTATAGLTARKLRTALSALCLLYTSPSPRDS